MKVVRHSWCHWRSVLLPEQLQFIKYYRKRILPLIHPFLSVLCRRKQPLHHQRELVEWHLKSTSWQGKTCPLVNSPVFAHHLFDPDACLYYVSGTGDYGLLAFDIDSKAGRTDALEQAEAIQRRYLLNGCSFVQTSTGGNGAYRYVWTTP